MTGIVQVKKQNANWKPNVISKVFATPAPVKQFLTTPAPVWGKATDKIAPVVSLPIPPKKQVNVKWDFQSPDKAIHATPNPVVIPRKIGDRLPGQLKTNRLSDKFAKRKP